MKEAKGLWPDINYPIPADYKIHDQNTQAFNLFKL